MSLSDSALRLTEYATRTGVQLSHSQLGVLRRLAPSVAVAPSIADPGSFDLTPGSYIGAVNLGSLEVEISPKIPIDHVLFLISYAVDPTRWRDLWVHFGRQASLAEAIIPGFVAQV